eukprot:4593218-Alexandrium_andersonii.AAC.1
MQRLRNFCAATAHHMCTNCAAAFQQCCCNFARPPWDVCATALQRRCSSVAGPGWELQDLR